VIYLLLGIVLVNLLAPFAFARRGSILEPVDDLYLKMEVPTQTEELPAEEPWSLSEEDSLPDEDLPTREDLLAELSQIDQEELSLKGQITAQEQPVAEEFPIAEEEPVLIGEQFSFWQKISDFNGRRQGNRNARPSSGTLSLPGHGPLVYVQNNRWNAVTGN